MKRVVLVTLVLFLLFGPLWPQKSPDEFFGKEIGSDRVLVAYPQICEYFAHLAAESDRLLWKNEGSSTLGQPMQMAVISTPANLAALDELTEINRLLSNPDQIPAGRETEILSRAKVFLLVTASLHATEIAASQMAMILAHRLVSSEGNRLQDMLENVVLLLMPSINPDGNIMVTDWYYKHLGTPYEGGPMPWLYHHYAGHDNNRDYFMLNLKESRVVNAILHQRYWPHIFLDMHQMGSSGPRMFVPPFKDPFNENLSPLMLREIDLIGSYLAVKLQEAGKKGVATAYGFDAYWPGGSKNTAWYKNVIGLLTELASVRVASPIHVDANELRGGGKGLPEYKPQVNFPDPWPGGWWHLRDIIDYELIACEALLEISSMHHGFFLQNFLARSKEQVQLGESTAPGAWVIPYVQHDDGAALVFLQKMAENGVRISVSNSDFRHEDKLIGKGDAVISMAQPYRAFIAAMMEIQRYPEIKFTTDGELITPYDAAGWTLPLLTGVQAYSLASAPSRHYLEELDPALWKTSAISGQGDHYLIPARNLASYTLVNRLLGQNKALLRARVGEENIKAGDFLLAVKDLAPGPLMKMSPSGLDIQKTVLPERLETIVLKKKRLAVYQSFIPSMDEGWTRWIFDHYELPFQAVKNADIQDKAFPGRFDVLIIPSMGRSVIVDGKRSADAPPALLPPAFQGGIGVKGLDNLREFVRRGGRLVLLDAAYEIAEKDFSLPLRNVLSGVSRRDFYCPGSILRLWIDETDPLGWGCPKESILFFAGSAAFRTSQPQNADMERQVAARFSDRGPHLLSGYLQGGHLLDRAVAAIRFSYQQGEVVVLGGRVQYRAQTLASFKMLFNSILR